MIMMVVGRPIEEKEREAEPFSSCSSCISILLFGFKKCSEQYFIFISLPFWCVYCYCCDSLAITYEAAPACEDKAEDTFYILCSLKNSVKEKVIKRKGDDLCIA